MALRIDPDFVRETLVRLIRIDSTNPTLVPGAAGEGAIARFVAESLGDCGVPAEICEPQPGRASVLARIAGRGDGRSLMLNAHVDTVGMAGMAEPFSGAVRDGKVYGRGAYDMKGSLAACMAAMKALAAMPLAGGLVLAAVADEEYGSLGTADILTRVRTDAAIVTEPTGLDVCLAHKGYLWIEVETRGRAAHGSRFELGIDANLKMGRFLAALAGLERDLRTRPPHPLVGPPSLHAARLEGGTELSTYAASSRVQIERRTVPGETVAQAVGEIQALVDRLAADDQEFHAAVLPFFARQPFEVPAAAPIVAEVERAAAAVLGHAPARMGDTPWMDAALLQEAGIPTVVFGPRGAGAHADVEWVDLESVIQLARILAATAAAWCGGE